MKVLTQKNIKTTILVVLLTNLFLLIINLVYQFLFTEVKMLLLSLLKQFLRTMNTVKIQNKHFNKILIMTEEEDFQSGSTCWICKKLIDDNNEKVRERFHIIGKFRGTAHLNCDINVHLTKIVPVIFHNLGGYGCHLIFHELKKFDVKINVIPNGLEKYIGFIVDKNLVFIDSMQFMNLI